MPALLSLHVRNFRSLEDVTVRLGPLNVLVGPNGAGKSNFLDVIAFLGDSVRSDLGPALEMRHGFDVVCFRGAKPKEIEIEVVAQVTDFSSENAPDEYDLYISTARRRGEQPGLLLRYESFKFKRTQRQGRRITIDGSNVEVVDERSRGGETSEKRELLRRDSLGLATLPRLAESEGGRQVEQIAKLFETFRVFEIDVQAARGPSLTRTAESLESDASNLAAFLLRLRSDPDRFAQLVEDARGFAPGLADIHFVSLGGVDEAVAIELEEEGLAGRTRLSEASYGTVRVLALLAMLYDPAPPLLTCVEEIDHGLHPYVFDRLVDRLRSASTNTQFIIATHSPALVNRLRPEELIVCERDPDTGASVIPVVDQQQIASILEARGAGTLGVGELWFSGTLGGVPA